jgi:hypothetical protein
LYDIKRLLRPGKNVIAIEVVRDSFPGSAQLLLRGFYQIKGSPVQEFWSDLMDQSWRASNTPDGIVNGYTWYNPALDDSFWSLPKKGPTNERFRVIQPVTLDPRLLETETRAKWIGAPSGSGSQASFAYSLRLPSDRQETWLQIAATGNYDLIINGRLITTVPVAPQPATVKVPAVQALIIRPPFLAYDVTRWMRTGVNSLYNVLLPMEVGKRLFTVKSDSRRWSLLTMEISRGEH